MNIIAVMVTRMALLRFFAVLAGIALFVLTLEMISYSSEILDLDASPAMAVGRYLLMRLPGTLATFIPISFLLAMLLTLAELSYRNETTAIWAMGISPLRLVVLLIPMAVAVGILHFVIADRAVPAVAPTLRQWGIADYGEKQLKIGERDPIWLRGGNDILRAARASPSSTVLHDVIIFKRNTDGLLTSQVMAETAKLEGGAWQLFKVRTATPGGALVQAADTLTYEGKMRPAQAGSRSGDPEEMTFSDLNYFVANSGFGIRPAYVYETWRHRRLAPLLTSLLMTALCIPLAARFRRGGGLGLLFAAGVGLGFLYFILDGIMVSAGELGFVAPWLAGWFPALAFGLLAAALVLRSERA